MKVILWEFWSFSLKMPGSFWTHAEYPETTMLWGLQWWRLNCGLHQMHSWSLYSQDLTTRPFLGTGSYQVKMNSLKSHPDKMSVFWWIREMWTQVHTEECYVKVNAEIQGEASAHPVLGRINPDNVFGFLLPKLWDGELQRGCVSLQVCSTSLHNSSYLLEAKGRLSLLGPP